MTSERKLLILFGSQTGTAEEVAEGLARDGFRRHFDVELSSLDQFDIQKLLHSRLAIFVCSTTGQGDPPSNMKKFWKFLLRKNLPADSLGNLHFVMVGLGDSSYIKYNFIGKKLYRRLCQLSASPVLYPVLCDEQHQLGSDAALDEHLPIMWEKILELFPLPSNCIQIPRYEILPPKFKVNRDQHPSMPMSMSMPNHVSTRNSSSAPFASRLISNERITSPEHFQDVRLIRLDISGSDIRYDVGDVAYLWPQNSQSMVETFLTLLSLDGSGCISIEPFASGTHIPFRLAKVSTWRDLATDYLDLSSVPTRYFFELMSHFSRDEQEKEKLEEFCSAEGQDARFSYCNRVKRSIIEVLTEFPNTTPYIPVNYILDLFPALQPRAFSIASAPQKGMAIIELLVAVVKYRTKLVEPRLGVCSNWLANMDSSADNTVPVLTEKGTLRFPAAGEPCILIGPGTGVAPFRSFLHKRVSQGHIRNLLIFGSRNKDGDFLCEDEWRSMVSDGFLQLLTAFSRDQPEKYYVWNAMQDNSELIWDWLRQEHSYIFVAGNAKRMPDDVRATLVNIVSEHLGDGEGEPYIAELEKVGRYQLECW
ncbi:NADPH-dependent diflavin oxidoreductase 1-like [Watersipora subatra]|uniref:NADPH-dependent diflavin oxidoreductase 1-like n=1 Tax=Watersipora subatra TaxID=2589382 RepID=UPI00355C8623